MQRSVRPMPQATCCQKEVNRTFSVAGGEQGPTTICTVSDVAVKSQTRSSAVSSGTKVLTRLGGSGLPPGRPENTLIEGRVPEVSDTS
jgi:hypothetical protein